MTKFDDKLDATLSAEDKAFLQDLENGRGLFEQLGATLQGPMRFWSYLITIITFFVAMGAFYSGWRAFNAVDTREIILWSTGVILLFMMVGFSKNWIFQRMNLLSVLSELKALELRISQLSDKIK
ncbi:DUF6768 family protein [Parasphingorhabdus cellanae]|uniref:Uncharacterized protein n=1 Tax=Parasphingorhabdus cellanae TaxID=2806553 RepID=A0ABX7SZL4_9SPHN|nr:DUF6768 family protein [Parasphingorhabdus cellanae]QTD54700.1 hypothetical protein J4G78_10540 [Parasphingorhabdus cellanae]